MDNVILENYYKMLGKYGEQGWWPYTLPNTLKPTYYNPEPSIEHRFEIAVGAVLTQNTNWKNVEKSLELLAKNRFLNLQKVISTDENLIKECIRSSGYYNLKYLRLLNMADWWLKNSSDILNYGCKNDDEFIKKVRESLLGVNGIGRETADSIMLYALDIPSFVIDTYTCRIVKRHYQINIPLSYDELRNYFMNSLPKKIGLYKEYHALFVRVAKETCLKKSCTAECVLK